MESRHLTSGGAIATALLVLSLAARASAEWTPASPPGCPARPEDPAAARALAGDMFDRASQRASEGDLEGAAGFYTCSYSIAPHPNTLYNLALAQEAARQLADACTVLDLYLQQAPNAINRPAAEAYLAELRSQLGKLDRAPPEPRALTEVSAEVRLDESGPSDLALTGWLLLGSGVALAAGGGTAFAVLADKERSLVLHPAEGTPWRDVARHRDAYELYRDLEIVFFVVGGAALAVGTALLIVDMRDPRESLSVGLPTPLIGPGFAGLGWTGRFDAL